MTITTDSAKEKSRTMFSVCEKKDNNSYILKAVFASIKHAEEYIKNTEYFIKEVNHAKEKK